MADNTGMDERLWTLLKVTDILDEIDYRLPLFMENFVKIEISKAKASGYEKEDLIMIKLELERIRSIYIQEVKEKKQEIMQEIFLEMKPDLDEITPEDIEIVIKFFKSKPGRNFKNKIIPLSEKIDKTINRIGEDIIKRA